MTGNRCGAISTAAHWLLSLTKFLEIYRKARIFLSLAIANIHYTNFIDAELLRNLGK